MTFCWHLSIHEREWWERQLFDAGFRKHPRYYAVLPYEELEHDPMQITMVMEKAAVDKAAVPGDMLRQTGRRSDAALARYQLAAALVRPGDRVLDVGCGAGEGTYLIRQNSLVRQAVGIDADESKRSTRQRILKRWIRDWNFALGFCPMRLA